MAVDRAKGIVDESELTDYPPKVLISAMITSEVTSPEIQVDGLDIECTLPICCKHMTTL